MFGVTHLFVLFLTKLSLPALQLYQFTVCYVSLGHRITNEISYCYNDSMKHLYHNHKEYEIQHQMKKAKFPDWTVEIECAMVCGPHVLDFMIL